MLGHFVIGCLFLVALRGVGVNPDPVSRDDQAPPSGTKGDGRPLGSPSPVIDGGSDDSGIMLVPMAEIPMTSCQSAWPQLPAQSEIPWVNHKDQAVRFAVRPFFESEINLSGFELFSIKPGRLGDLLPTDIELLDTRLQNSEFKGLVRFSEPLLGGFNFYALRLSLNGRCVEGLFSVQLLPGGSSGGGVETGNPFDGSTRSPVSGPRGDGPDLSFDAEGPGCNLDLANRPAWPALTVLILLCVVGVAVARLRSSRSK